MCGRFVARFSIGELIEDLAGILPGMEIRADPALPDVVEDYNVAPTRDVVVAVPGTDGDLLQITMMHWGLVPAWAKDATGASRMINARIENLRERPSYRGLLGGKRHHRCVVPMSGFYEWHGAAGAKQPIHVRRPDGQPMFVAGLWTSSERLGLRSTTLVTRDAYRDIAPWHHRSPAVVAGDDLVDWLTGEGDGVDELAAAAEPDLEVMAVGREVNNVRNNHPGLVSPTGPPGPAPV